LIARIPSRERKIHEKGFVIAEIPLKKKRFRVKGLSDSQNSMVKRERICEKGSVKA
jgi:hypothetical protein